MKFSDYNDVIVESIDVKDIRFIQQKFGDGSDAMNNHTDYSNPYIIINTNGTVNGIPLEGHGISFSLGRGNDFICAAINEIKDIIVGKSFGYILKNYKIISKSLTNPFQSRWLGPHCGPHYMAAGAILNAYFDLWAKLEKKPLWELLVRLDPESLISLIDIENVEHIISEDEIRSVLLKSQIQIDKNIKKLKSNGMNAYFTTWIGKNKFDLLEQILSVREDRGFNDFKIKIGLDIKEDEEKIAHIKKYSEDIKLYVDANQMWGIKTFLKYLDMLSNYKIEWIEEPFPPYMIDLHKIAKDEANKFNIDIVSGENCPNSGVASQFISSGALNRFQIDACRVAGPIENILIMLIAKKFDLPICPHAGGSGLDELVPHLAAWNYLSCNPNSKSAIIEQVGFCSKYFNSPSNVYNGRLMLPLDNGYLVGMNEDSMERFSFIN